MVRDLAARQHGVVARRQLLDAGLTAKALHVRLTSGRLLPLHRGVYAVGHCQLRREGHWLAAVLAVGPGAALSHRDAAALHGIRPSNRPSIDVTSTARAARRARIDVHHTTVLDAEDVTTVDGIPVTTVARTLVDLAGVVARDHLTRAIKEADARRVLDVHALRHTLARTIGRQGRGHQAMKEALAELDALATTLTRSPLEDAFLDLVRRTGLPIPRTNVLLNGFEVDALWPSQRLVVELDGFAHHRTRHAFQRDRTRDATLTRAGYAVLRFTHADIAARPAWVADTIRATLASGPRATMSGPCP